MTKVEIMNEINIRSDRIKQLSGEFNAERNVQAGLEKIAEMKKLADEISELDTMYKELTLREIRAAKKVTRIAIRNLFVRNKERD